MKPYYEDGAVTIYHGDCGEILPELPRSDLLLTDPPYGIFACGGKWGRKALLEWDRQPVVDLVADLLPVARAAIVWGGNYYAFPPSRGWLVWWKPDSVPSAADVELAWTSFDMNSKMLRCTIAATNAERNGHPTQKPEAVMRWCLTFAPLAETVVDPYMGSGTTLRAAKDMGKRAIGIEIEERYCEIAAKRCAQEVLAL